MDKVIASVVDHVGLIGHNNIGLRDELERLARNETPKV